MEQEAEEQFNFVKWGTESKGDQRLSNESKRATLATRKLTINFDSEQNMKSMSGPFKRKNK